MHLREWATRDLRRGDLTALVQGSRVLKTANDERAQRLSRRGFIRIDTAKRLRLTAKGRIALVIKWMEFVH